MSGESDFDDDIDKLLDEIDSAGTQKKGGKGPGTKSVTEENPEDNAKKVELKSDGNGIKVNYGGGGFKLSDLNKPAGDTKVPPKAVHFPEEPIISPPPTSTKPNFLSNLLGKEPRPESPTPQKPPAKSSAAKADWLGLGPDSSQATPASPKATRKIARQPANDSSINFDDDDDNDERLKAMGLDSARKPKEPEEPKRTMKAGPAGSAKPKTTGFDLDDDFWPNPGSFKPPVAPNPQLSAKSETFDKPEPTTARSALLQRAAMARERDESPFETPTTAKFQPQATSTPASTQPKSIVDVLPFLKRPGTGGGEQPESLEPERAPSSALRSFSPAPPGPLPPTTNKNPAPQPLKGKAKRSAAAASVSSPAPPPTQLPESQRTTLQLPSHLVDEDELKSMCNSLKSLYSNQLEMLEKSYLEQMDCLLQSHSRKEDLLKEEIKLLHKEYDSRLTRLKNELLESETKLPQRLQSELSAIANFNQQQQQQQQQLQQSQSMFRSNVEAIESPRSVQNQSVNATLTPQDVERVLEEKLPAIVESLKLVMLQENPNKDLKDLTTKLDGVQRKFESFASYKMEEESKKTMQIIESEKKLQLELSKLYKQQKRAKESLVKAAVTAVSHTLQYQEEENSHRKDKISSQLKEFRKDVRRILFDLESKNDAVQKSHKNIESDQKEILQTLRDLQTVVQVNSVRDKFATMTPQMWNASNQQSQQTELEAKLLREERNALSESMAQINVERRKLNEERLNLEHDKMSFERERNRLRDLEVQLRVKTAEAEDMKKQAEEVRKTETAKVMEATVKSSEIEKERSLLKEQLRVTENKLRLREQKLLHEKAELMREREFTEKLRDQLLCPGCMKSVNHLASRSEGDGLDISISGEDISSKLTGLLKTDDGAYFQKESLYLDDLYYKQFNPK